MAKLWRGEADAELAAVLASCYPGLHLGRERPRVIAGAFNVEHEGIFLAGYQIEIDLRHVDSLGLPVVREVGGRVPRLPERHVNADGSACLYLPEALIIQHSQPLGIREFLDGPVRSFFLGQAWLAAGRPFPFGEWGHGIEGLVEMLSELFGSDDMKTCGAFLLLLRKKIVKAHWSCPCGSRRRIRDCHYRRVYGLRERLSLRQRRLLCEEIRQRLMRDRLATKAE